MKFYLLVFLIVVSASCKNQEKEEEPFEETVNQQDTSNADLPPGNIQEERDALQTNRQTKLTDTAATAGLEGNYKKMDDTESKGSCSCHCIEVDFDSPSDLCLDSTGMTILVRYDQKSNTSADVYLIEPQDTENMEHDLPWEDFDNNLPIAELNLQPDGSIELDWIGFSIDGELAVDYAIYGKKALEGTYKKEN